MSEVLLIKILVVCVIFLIFSKTGLINTNGFGDDTADIGSLYQEMNSFSDFALLIFLLCLVEEFLFRFLPILVMLSYLIFSKNNNVLRENVSLVKNPFLILVGIVTSVVFGYAHGNWLNIALQGIVGLITFYYYIWAIQEWTKARGGNVLVNSGLLLTAPVLLHFFYNMSLYSLDVLYTHYSLIANLFA